MNGCKVPEVRENMEYQYITEDSKTRVYLSMVREFNEEEYKKYFLRRKKAKMRKRVLFAVRSARYVISVLVSMILYHVLSQKLYLERGSSGIGSEVFLVGLVGAGLYWFLSWLIGGDAN